jgi:hypothetical protein
MGNKVIDLLSQNISNAQTNIKNWNNLMYNVLEYKVKGDGVTDDTVALQALVNKAISEGRKAIGFPHTKTGGQYFVTSLTNADQVEFFGDNASFIGGYTGEIAQLGDWETPAQRNSLMINVKYPPYPLASAKGDSTTDDSPAISGCIAYLNARGGGTLFIPNGDYRLLGALEEITAPMAVVGNGRFNSFFRVPTNGINVITINSNFCRVSDLGIMYTGSSPASGSGILLKGGAHSTIERCNIHDFRINVDSIAGYDFMIINSFIYNAELYNVKVANSNDPDAGDSILLGNVFEAFSKPNMMAHVYQQSSGGLRLTSNKMLHGKNGMVSEIVDGSITSILVMTGNSIELQTESFVTVQRAGTTGRLPLISITGNEMRSDDILKGIMISDGTDTIAIGGNVLLGEGTGTAIEINNTAKDVAITGNTFKTWDTGIKLNFTGPNLTGEYARATVGNNQFADDVAYTYRNTGYAQDTAIECRHEHSNNVVAATNTTYVSIYRIDLGTYTGGTFEIDIYGIVNSVGGFTRNIKKLISRAAAGVTVTAISDTAAGETIDVNFDVTTVSGSVIVQVRKGAATGTTLNGTAAISVRGGVIGFKAYNSV